MSFNDVFTVGPTPPTPVNRLRKEGDYVIKFIKLVAFNGAEYDVTQIQFATNIYEDIFHNCVCGDITLQDANDLPQLLPIVGQERIKIRFTRPEVTEDGGEDLLPDIDVDYRVYKMSERQLEKDKFQLYTLYFVADEFITNFKTKLTLGFKALPYSEMATIAFEMLGSTKPFEVEETLYEHDWVSPNVPPFEFINALASRSTSAGGMGSTYLFFSDREKFHYKSLGLLLSQEPVEVYTYQWSNILDNKPGGGYRPRTVDQDLKTFDRYGFANSFDVIKNLASGMYGSRLLTYDITRQIFETKDFDYTAEFDSFVHLDKHKPHTDELDALGAPQAFCKFRHTNLDHDKIPWIAGKEPGIKPYHVEDYVLYRYSQMQQMISNNRLRVGVSGDPRRKVGEIIEFKLPQAVSKVNKENPEELDNYLQGKYIIISIAHKLSKENYYIEAEIIKDTFFSEITHVDPLDFYKDTW